MSNQIPDVFQQLDIEIANRPGTFNDYLQENLPLVYINVREYPASYNNVRACPLPYESVKKYLQRGIDWMWYLFNNPGEYTRCNFSLLDETELTYLLKEMPEMGCCIQWRNVLPEEKKQILLAYHPQWAESRDELKKLSSLHWVKLLILHPEYGFIAPWQKFSGKDWQKLLSEHPEFAQHCDFNLLEVDDWEVLLINQVRFFSFCPAELRKKFSPKTLYELFTCYPEIKNLWEK